MCMARQVLVCRYSGTQVITSGTGQDTETETRVSAADYSTPSTLAFSASKTRELVGSMVSGTIHARARRNKAKEI